MDCILRKYVSGNLFWKAQSLTLPRFVDRDMFMRYVGGGVGHRSNPHAEAYKDEVDQDDDMDIDIENDPSVHA